MSYSVKILADTVATNATGEDVRLTSMEIVFPRFLLAEFNTHRVFSRNSASSRAIPVERRIAQVKETPFVPEAFTRNKRGMQADENVNEYVNAAAVKAWLRARDAAIAEAERLVELGVHKQHANRVLEPWCWHTVVVTATDWANFFALRCDIAPQPEMQIIAKLMRDGYLNSEPRRKPEGTWHLPYLTDDELYRPADGFDYVEAVKVSVVRCAAVSYERQHIERSFEDCVKRHDELAKMGHWSPFEHQARIDARHYVRSNFRPPFLQYRKFFGGEEIFKP